MHKNNLLPSICSILVLLLAIPDFVTASDGFKIEEAKWDSERARLTVKGKGQEGKRVELFNAGTMEQIAGKRLRDNDWRVFASRVAI